MAYRLLFPTESLSQHFEKVLTQVPKNDQKRIKAAVESLSENPRPPGKKTKILSPPLEVFQYVARYRLRIGDYRVLYDVDDVRRIVWIYDLRRRTERTYK